MTSRTLHLCAHCGWPAVKIFEQTDPLVVNGTYDVEGYRPGERARIARHQARVARLEAEMTKRRAAAKANGKAGRAKPVPPRTPRQPNLPGTDDRAIRDLEETAQHLADVRTQSTRLQLEVVTLKDRLLHMMKAHGKRSYHRKGIAIDVVAENETVKVRVQRADEEAGPAEP